MHHMKGLKSDIGCLHEHDRRKIGNGVPVEKHLKVFKDFFRKISHPKGSMVEGYMAMV
jgi:hypothetical protein